jgi:hypothetical protein
MQPNPFTRSQMQSAAPASTRLYNKAKNGEIPSLYKFPLEVTNCLYHAVVDEYFRQQPHLAIISSVRMQHTSPWDVAGTKYVSPDVSKETPLEIALRGEPQLYQELRRIRVKSLTF